MNILKVSPYFIDAFLGILASPEQQYEDEVLSFDGTNLEDVNNIIKLIILPSFCSMNPWSKELAKKTLQYYLTKEEVTSLSWILEGIANEKSEYDEIMFWTSVWKHLYSNESSYVEDLDRYEEVLDWSDASNYKKQVYEQFVSSKK
jgi:hypothetical protein